MKVEPTGGALGARVWEIDLRRELSPETVAALREAFLEHQVLLFRDQTLGEEDQVRFTRYFGEPSPHVREQPDRPVKEIFIISNVTVDGKPIGALGSEEIEFHSDLSYLQEPGTISMLYAIEVPAEGGNTMWANGYASCAELPADLRERVGRLQAFHVHPRAEQNPKVPARHPVIRPHAETGRPVLYVNPYFTTRIDGVPEAESRELLARLLAHATDRRFVWVHRWRAGDLVMWDNRCTMHRREAFPPSARRIMKRTQVFGGRPGESGAY